MWMQLSPTDWATDDHYRRLDKLLRGIVCVNDVAERNVQNVVEFAEFSKDPERRDRVDSVVNSHRELVNFHNPWKMFGHKRFFVVSIARVLNDVL